MNHEDVIDLFQGVPQVVEPSEVANSKTSQSTSQQLADLGKAVADLTIYVNKSSTTSSSAPRLPQPSLWEFTSDVNLDSFVDQLPALLVSLYLLSILSFASFFRRLGPYHWIGTKFMAGCPSWHQYPVVNIYGTRRVRWAYSNPELTRMVFRILTQKPTIIQLFSKN